MQARGEFAQVERLEQVIVGPGLQAVDPVGDRIAGGEDQHRQLQAVVPQLLQELESVFVRQPEVQHHHIKFGDLEHRPRR
ncbi:hypothetical protein D9M71_838850 [compost metagenome]